MFVIVWTWYTDKQISNIDPAIILKIQKLMEQYSNSQVTTKKLMIHIPKYSSRRFIPQSSTQRKMVIRCLGVNLNKNLFYRQGLMSLDSEFFASQYTILSPHSALRKQAWQLRFTKLQWQEKMSSHCVINCRICEILTTEPCESR